MLLSDEEQRASDYRAMMIARQRNREANEKSLAGSTAARTALQDDWTPLILALQEAQQTTDDCDPFDPS